MQICELVHAQREFFNSGATLDLRHRINSLEILKDAILRHESDIYTALSADLGKSDFESFMCEIGMILSELGYIKKRLRKWVRPKKYKTPLSQFYSRSFSVRDPFGIVLIMSPWNYPLLLCIEPLLAAIAAGNCAILKPSAYSPATSSVIKLLIEECFEPEFVAVVEGGREENTLLLEEKFDYIFFTGSAAVGKLVMEKASKNLTPVTLELGGKSPCIVDENADLRMSARRIVFGKYLNLGQTCISPDYLLVDAKIKDKLIPLILNEIKRQFGEDPLQNPDYGKIINQKHFARICSLIDSDKVIFGGENDPSTQKIAPTVMDNVTAEDAVMQEEIFGPVLPILTYDTLDDAIEFVRSRPKPLSLYLFTESRDVEKKVLDLVSFGGGCINDTIIHLATSDMPFGGVGGSGMGSYHGKHGFDTFSHEKSIVRKSTALDMAMRYQPYTDKHKKAIRKLMK